MIGEEISHSIPGDRLCLAMILEESKQISLRRTKGYAIPGGSNLALLARKSMHHSLRRRAIPSFQPVRSRDEEEVASFRDSLNTGKEIEGLDEPR